MSHSISARLRPLLGAALVLSVVAGVSAQRRQSQPKAVDFPSVLTTAEKAFAAKDFAAAQRALQQATKLCQALQREQILAAMPEVDGFTKRAQPKTANRNAAGLGMFGALAGMQAIEQEYTKGDQHITIKVTPASPLVAMMKMAIGNPAMLAAQGGQELIEYDNCKALLDSKNAKRVKLTVLVGESSTVEVESRNMTEDQVLKVMSQSNLNKLLDPLGHQ